MDRKEKQVERYLKGMKRVRSQAEQKELGRRSNERKAQQRSKGRGRARSGHAEDWLEDEDETVDYETIRRAPKVTKAELARSIAARAEDDVDAVEEAELVGLVVSLAPGRARVWIEAEDEDGVGEFEAVLSDALAKTQRTSVAVGDELDLEVLADGSLRARGVLERRSRLARPDPQNPHVERVLAANVDVAVIVAAVRNPELRHRLIDRYLIAVQAGGIEPVVCANKADLADEDLRRDELDGRLEPYRALGVPVLYTSGETGEGVDALREELRGKTVVFVGQSGVGKSSLMNALVPELGLETGRVREGDGKGRHTTTSSTLLDVGGGTRLIDTPGVRSFGLVDVTRASLDRYFPELEALRGGCRFRDCSHAHEPACAVRAAAEAGEVSAQRYDTYLRILGSIEE